MTNAFTFAQEPEGNELVVAQVDDLCGFKRLALVTKEEYKRRCLLVKGRCDAWRTFLRGIARNGRDAKLVLQGHWNADSA